MNPSDLTLDERGFADLFESHRRELRAHCYRMAGALGEAEDLVQETFLRAWRARRGFEGRSTARAWLFRIATNACLDALAGRERRVLPSDVVSEGAPTKWLEPCPEHLLDPADGVVARETLELAFLAAIQHLSPRQRAAFLLRDVLGWPAGQVAAALQMTVPAVKSALQRARATLRDRLPQRREQWAPREATADEQTVLRRYVEAHRRGDQRALADVLAEELRVEFPPLPLQVDGRQTYLDGIRLHADPGVYRWVATAANHQPAVAVFLRAPGAATFSLRALQVLSVVGDRITRIVDFHDPNVLDSFSPAIPSELA